MSQPNRREIAYILRMRNQAGRDIRQFSNQIRTMSRDVNRSLATIGRTSPFTRLNQQSARAAQTARNTATSMGRSYSTMATQARNTANAVIREQSRIMQSTNRLRANQARGIAAARVRQATGGAPARASSARGTNSGAAQAASIAAFSGIAGAAADARGQIEGLLSAAAMGYAIAEVTRYADAWTNLSNRLQALGTPAQNVADTQREIIDIANRSRAAFEGVSTAYTRMQLASRELGATQAQVARATETVSKAMNVSGATTAEANATIIQLGQALGAGVLNGDELRSIRENAPLLAQAIAKEFETTTGGLKKLGEEGKLVADRVFKAIIEASAETDKMFDKTVSTIAQSLNVLRNSFIEFIGTADQSLRISERVASGFLKMAGAFRENRAAIEGITVALTGLAGVRLASIVAGWGAAFLGLTGPVGLVMAAIAAVVGYLITNRDTMVTVGDTTVSVGALMQSVWEGVKRGIELANNSLDGLMEKLSAIANHPLFIPGYLYRFAMQEDSKGRTLFGAIGDDIGGMLGTNFGDRAQEIDKEKYRQRQIEWYGQYGRSRVRGNENPMDTSNLKGPGDTKASDKAAKDRAREIERANDQLRNHILTLKQEELTLGLVGQERQRVTALMAFERQLLSMENLTSEERLQLLKEYDAKLRDHLQTMQSYQTSQRGMIAALQEYAEEAGNAFDNSKAFMENTLSSVEDALTEFMTTGKLDWKQFISSLIADFMRLMIIRPMMARLAKAMSPDGVGLGGSGGPSFLEAAVSAITGLGGTSLPNTVNAVPTARPSQSVATGFTAPVGEVIRTALPPIIDASSARVAQAHATATAAAMRPVTQKLSEMPDILQNVLDAGSVANRSSGGFDLASIRQGNAILEGSSPALMQRMSKMMADMPADLQGQVKIFSAYRSPEKQKSLWDAALNKYGSPEAARKWVAPPGSSNHNYGNAFDLKYQTDAARQWMHQNAGQYGLQFPMRHEPWHIEPKSDAGGRLRAGQMATQQVMNSPVPANIDTSAITNSVTQVNQSMQQMGTNLQQVSTNAQMASNGMSTAGLNVQQAGVHAQQAGPQFQQAGQQIQQAGQQAQSSAPAVGGFGQNVGGLQAPLQQATGGLGGFGQGLMGLVQQLFSGFGGGGGGGGGFGGIFSSILGMFFHKGGIVGQNSGLSRSVSAMAWGGAQKYHSGGIVGSGLKKGERPIIAKDNEAVMPTVRLPDGTFGVKSVGGGNNGGGGTFVASPVVNISVEGGRGSPEEQRHQAETIAKEARAAIRAEMTTFAEEQMRNGGMFNQRGFS